ncbi:MAG: hypothetical protein IT235_04285 [Bacteroidia bacterium]|nr:hypothetical protein [Bacteroidia bacterium]
MKKTIVSFLIFIALACVASAQNKSGETPKKTSGKNSVPKTSKNDCLAMVGYFANPELKKSVRVKLYDGNKIIDSLSVNPLMDFGFVLKRNKKYSIQVSSPNYYNRFFLINTALSDSVSTPPLFVFEFEITLLRQMAGVDDFLLDFPIAKIAYIPSIGKFSFNEKYTNNMQKEIKRAEGEFKIRKSK